MPCRNCDDGICTNRCLPQQTIAQRLMALPYYEACAKADERSTSFGTIIDKRIYTWTFADGSKLYCDLQHSNLRTQEKLL